MQARFLSLLPSELQAAVVQAEELAGCEVVIRPDDRAEAFDNLSLGLDQATGQYYATIAYKGSEISRCALVHEVLHLKRYWIDEVPMLGPGDDRLSWLEGLLEHLVIVPEEQRFAREESNAHWQKVLAQQLGELPAFVWYKSKEEVLAARRRILFQQRAMLDIALPDLGRVAVYDWLDKDDLLPESEAFIRDLRALAHDKQRAVNFAVPAFGYMPTFQLGFFKLRERPPRFVKAAVTVKT